MLDTGSTCFVIGQIGSEGSEARRKADWLLEDIIIPAVQESGFSLNVLRADKISAPGDINIQVINYVIDSKLVIADLSDENPNAFYELALRHFSSAPVIHLIPKGARAPFDVSTFRAISFSFDHVSERDRTREELKRAIAETQRGDYQVQNPVILARGFRESESKLESSKDVLADMITNVASRVQAMERILTEAHDAAVPCAQNLGAGQSVSKELLRSFIMSFIDDRRSIFE